MTKLELLRQRKHDILALARQHGAADLRVFGSVARGAERPESDIDFLVHLQPGTTYFTYLRLVRSLENLLQNRVDVVLDTAIKPVLRDRIVRSAVPL